MLVREANLTVCVYDIVSLFLCASKFRLVVAFFFF